MGQDFRGDNMTIADRIREKRISLDLSQTELAKRAGYTDRTTISKLEHMGNDITMKQVKRVAEALGVSSAYLMGWDNDNNVNIDVEDNANNVVRARALLMYEKYLSADKDIQNVVETLLKIHQQDS